jgi:Flp pilus assembly protein TadG
MKRYDTNSERGVATIEFAVTAAFFFMMLLAVFAGGYLFWVHNALVESTRRGARYAANECRQGVAGCPDSATALDRVKKVTLYGTPTPAVGVKPLVSNLQPANVIVVWSDNTAPAGELPNDFGTARGTVSVKIQNYDFNFILSPIPIPMPPYQTTVVGESAGFIPEVTCN